MKKILLSTVLTSGLAALTVGLAAPAVATPALNATTDSTISISAGPQEFPRLQNNTEKVDKRDKQRFNTEVNHPYLNSLNPRPSRSPGITPGQSPGSLPLGPIVGRR
ncbi:hypothetical protein [[Mycobacterium] wendilense]|uniref:Serine protease n=1 Tax=[Mycobacterium] wendilense TaxID=3064284 RepID=A0ABM9MA69_9MYCO|nr:hypothetical protein [Mycolicibacterium sp. MU0050]CAJ1580232.1 hypothetical protein MU0050_000925 [Mycolicibacterium sp. MU0050]